MHSANEGWFWKTFWNDFRLPFSRQKEFSFTPSKNHKHNRDQKHLEKEHKKELFHQWMWSGSLSLSLLFFFFFFFFIFFLGGEGGESFPPTSLYTCIKLVAWGKSARNTANTTLNTETDSDTANVTDYELTKTYQISQ